MQISPNPSINKINIDIHSPKANKTIVIIADLSGKILKQQQTELFEGLNSIQLNIQQLSKGSFLLKLVSVDNIDVAFKKFIKE